MSSTDRALQNGAYVRRLLQDKRPEFVAVLERAVRELACTCDAPPANRRRSDACLGRSAMLRARP